MRLFSYFRSEIGAENGGKQIWVLAVGSTSRKRFWCLLFMVSEEGGFGYEFFEFLREESDLQFSFLVYLHTFVAYDDEFLAMMNL